MTGLRDLARYTHLLQPLHPTPIIKRDSRILYIKHCRCNSSLDIEQLPETLMVRKKKRFHIKAD
jgi:hypothetical protein